jgi:GntR family transcriptional regulator/MocR family aminotransferase
MGKTATLPIRLEDSGDRTLQDQIYAGIRRCILEGLLDRERRLPSTRALAAELGVSRTTVLLAVENLQAEGYLVSRRGSGTFVAEELPDPALRLVRVRPAPDAPRHPLLSERGRALAGAPSPDRRGAGPPCAFRLGTPAVDLFPLRLWSQITRRCVRSAGVACLDYSSFAGLPALREGIAEQVGSRGTSCDPEQVIVTAGAQRALDLAFHLLLDPGDSVWMEDPGYPGARNALRAAGARVMDVPVDAKGMIVDGLGDVEGVRLAYVTPSHQFPLGVAMGLDRRKSLLAWARAHRAWVVEDDYDCDFRYRARPLPCLHALDPDGRVIYVGTFSKTLFPSLRLGFLIVPRDLVDGFVRARFASDVHPPVLEQAVVAEFMARGHYQRHLRRLQAAYAERLDALRSAVEASGAPLRLRPVHSGLHAVADVEGAQAEAVALEAAARGVEVMPLSHYHADGRDGGGLILGFGATRPAAMRPALHTLAAAIEAARRAGGRGLSTSAPRPGPFAPSPPAPPPAAPRGGSSHRPAAGPRAGRSSA